MRVLIVAMLLTVVQTPVTDPSRKDIWDKFYICLTAVLVLVGICTFIAIWYQAVKTRDAAEATQRSATAARDSVDALINSERAWIDGELIRNTNVVKRYLLKITNHGKTPAQVYGYEVSWGLLVDGTEFSLKGLNNKLARNVHVFLASGDNNILQEFNLDEMFAGSDGTEKGAFCVKIRYGDVITKGQKDLEPHETSFVCLYVTLVEYLERIAWENKYT
jgi:hypothetical protein